MRGVYVIGSQLKSTKLPELYRIIPAELAHCQDLVLLLCELLLRCHRDLRVTLLMAMGLAAEPLVRVKEYPSECHRLRLVFFHNLQHRGSSCVLWPTFSFKSLKLLNGASWVHTSTPATPTTQSVISADASLSVSLSHLFTTAAPCCGFAAEGSADTRYRSVAAWPALSSNCGRECHLCRVAGNTV